LAKKGINSAINLVGRELVDYPSLIHISISLVLGWKSPCECMYVYTVSWWVRCVWKECCVKYCCVRVCNWLFALPANCHYPADYSYISPLFCSRCSSGLGSLCLRIALQSTLSYLLHNSSNCRLIFTHHLEDLTENTAFSTTLVPNIYNSYTWGPIPARYRTSYLHESSLTLLLLSPSLWASKLGHDIP
jgi:hypothetical protein